jgi:hypothetical protein
MMRKFWLERIVDVSGVSGTGIVAEGVEFSDGRCAMRWTKDLSSVAIYDSVDALIAIHGHNGTTSVLFEESRVHAD